MITAVLCLPSSPPSPVGSSIANGATVLRMSFARLLFGVGAIVLERVVTDKDPTTARIA